MHVLHENWPVLQRDNTRTGMHNYEYGDIAFYKRLPLYSEITRPSSVSTVPAADMTVILSWRISADAATVMTGTRYM